ncbi:MAG: head GIN domain-containing protein [Rhodoferax sp.]
MNPLRTRFLHAKLLACIASTVLLLGAPNAMAWGFSSAVQGSGQVVTVNRTVSGIRGVSVELPAEVTLVQAATESVTLETDDNLVPLVETVVENGQLHIRKAEKQGELRAKTLRLTVTAPTFERLVVSGSGSLRAQALKAATLKTSVAGSGRVRVDNLDAETFKASIAGSGEMDVAGRADKTELSVAGSGDYRAAKLLARQAKVSVAGSGDATVFAQESLTISVAGSGDVRYYGDAAVTQSIAGSGSVRYLGKVTP